MTAEEHTREAEKLLELADRFANADNFHGDRDATVATLSIRAQAHATLAVSAQMGRPVTAYAVTP